VSTTAGPTGSPSTFVNPFVGTDATANASPKVTGNFRVGSTFPGAALPFGMVQWSPDTPQAIPAGYAYADDTIDAFSLTHLSGAGCSAERDFPVFPFATQPDFGISPEDGFSHADEKASPGFYEVKLQSGIVVDLTATARSGLARFTFPPGADAHVTVTAGRRADMLLMTSFDAHVVGSDALTGSRTSGSFCFTNSHYTVHFAARFDRPFSDFGTFDGGIPTTGSRDVSSVEGGLYLRFPTDGTRVVHMKVGLSYVSVENALANLEVEDPGWDFDAVHTAAIGRWNDYLGRVIVAGGSDDDQRAFYTALYHAFLQPAVFSDVDGSAVGFDGRTLKDSDHPRYANFSGWDVYRCWIHLTSVLAPKEASAFVRSIVAAGGECGAMPKWSLANDETGVMVGTPADPTIAGAWAFGVRDFDAAAAQRLMVRGATDPTAKCHAYLARPGLSDYLARGFCPSDERATPSGTSITLEYALDDFAIAQFAGATGDSATSATFLGRAKSWHNVFDPTYTVGAQKGFMQPRLNADVSGQPNFRHVDPSSEEGFVEGSAAQYTFVVPHDPYGLVAALGGDATTVARLDDLFTQLNDGTSSRYLYIGNEPSFATPWLYPFAGAPHRTQAIVRKILHEVFTTSPGGLPGNDDLGAMSAWQAWAMLGMYPVVPGNDVLVLGSPLFDKATVKLPSGATLVVTGHGGGPDAPYVQSVTMNGAPLTRSFVRWSELANGATLDFALGPTANTAWGAAPAERPPDPYH
jgi:predicted alpha-1,2-mannosidase